MATEMSDYPVSPPATTQPRTAFPYTKMQSVGNEMIVLDEGQWPADTDWAREAIRLCDRRTGVGSDGLMVMGPSGTAQLRARMFNPDGTEDMCGNGIRCVLHLAREQGRIGASGVVETVSGNVPFSIPLFPPSAGGIATVLGVPRYAPQDLPMTVDVDRVLDYPLDVDGARVIVSVVSTGTTHTILFVDELPDDARFHSLSPRIEHHPLFPERTSVIWTRVEGPDRLRLRIWERGVGETKGCGTGAAAAMAVASLLGRVARDAAITVASAGGELKAWFAGDNGDEVALWGVAGVMERGAVDAEAGT